MVGHQHGHGVAVEATRGEAGPSLCRSETMLGSDPHMVMAMTPCTFSQPFPELSWGETVTLHSEYNSTHPADDVMGIMLAYIDRL